VVYENLVSGAIDATEWVGPWNDSFMKFYEAAKFYYYPGMHEPAAQLSLGINKKFWDSLSKSDQLIVKAAAEMENSVMMSEYNAKNGASLAQLISDQGVKLRSFNDDIYDSFGDAAAEVFEEVQQHSPMAKKIHESFVASRDEVGAWAKISDQAYVAQRNRVLGL
jgi:TRAP-type mannitol/chloroaromatic compound transport system substrate-binding protein